MKVLSKCKGMATSIRAIMWVIWLYAGWICGLAGRNVDWRALATLRRIEGHWFLWPCEATDGRIGTELPPYFTRCVTLCTRFEPPGVIRRRWSEKIGWKSLPLTVIMIFPLPQHNFIGGHKRLAESVDANGRMCVSPPLSLSLSPFLSLSPSLVHLFMYLPYDYLTLVSLFIVVLLAWFFVIGLGCNVDECDVLCRSSPTRIKICRSVCVCAQLLPCMISIYLIISYRLSLITHHISYLRRGIIIVDVCGCSVCWNNDKTAIL